MKKISMRRSTYHYHPKTGWNISEFLFLLILTILFFLSPLNSIKDCEANEIKLPDIKYGENKPMSKKILVAYGTRAGSTAEVADAVGKKLAQGGAIVDVKSVKNVHDINGYQAIVLGSAIRAGHVLPEILDFVKQHKSDLQKLPVAYFVVGMTLREDTPEKRKIVNAYLDPLRAEITTVDVGLFAGKMDYSKLGFFEKFIIKNMIKVPEGDLRNWPEINNWAEKLLPKLTGVKKE
jgi:menaquinone-dependent protoporphyrinogen oxidase